MENPVCGKIIWLGLKFGLNRKVDKSNMPLLIFFYTGKIYCVLALQFIFCYGRMQAISSMHGHKKLSNEVCKKTLKFVEIAISRTLEKKNKTTKPRQLNKVT